jgi:aromatic ring hydroxylase
MSAFPLARSGKNDVGKYHHGNNKVPHRHSPLSNRPRTQKVANHWSRLAPNWFGRRRYEGTHALYFRSIGSTWSAGLNYPEYHATDIAFGEAAAAFTGRPLGIRNAPESSFSAQNDAEKSHQTDFSRRVCGYRRTAQKDDSLNSSEADVASRSSPIGEPELTLRSKPVTNLEHDRI